MSKGLWPNRWPMLASINHFQRLVALACTCAVLIGWQRIHR
ncbi:hypothetical protein [Pseudomonas sessilinigenes]|nr:hypothetical protein [Pseudomonas sessilinigenes]AZC26545.1 hypothetical protein C4K39_4900 [Pseudomonas sessilinigenes]